MGINTSWVEKKIEEFEAMKKLESSENIKVINKEKTKDEQTEIE